MRRPSWLGGPGRDADGSERLTGREAGDYLARAVEDAGGRLESWRIDHVDANPGRSTTATYRVRVDWPEGQREELYGMSVGADDPGAEGTPPHGNASREVTVWRYPDDPDLPGLARAAYPEDMAEALAELGLVDGGVRGDDLDLRMIAYRPRRRAVLRVDVARPRRRLYVKVLRDSVLGPTLARHDLLTRNGVPSPRVLGVTEDDLLVLDGLPGRPLSEAIFDAEPPCTAEGLITLLDGLPGEVVDLPRRQPWSASVEHYARIVAGALPDEEERLGRLVSVLQDGLADVPEGCEPTHGDFHEGQLHVHGGRVCGLLDVETVGPGRRADDLACLVAHLSTVQRMNAEQTARVHDLLSRWMPVFDERVDPVELRLRAAAVVVSLATGPYRTQEPNWQEETRRILAAADSLVQQTR